jgi:hypothetical protein
MTAASSVLRSFPVGTDVCALVRRDHEDLDRTLSTLLDSSRRGTRGDQLELLDAFRIGLVAHVAAEAAVLASMVVRSRPPLLVRLIVKQLDDEHRAQLSAIDQLASEQVGSASWSERLLELRIDFLDHAAREDYFPSSLHDHVASQDRRLLAGEYATERMRALAALAPVAIAREAALIRFN